MGSLKRDPYNMRRGVSNKRIKNRSSSIPENSILVAQDDLRAIVRGGPKNHKLNEKE
jgi:hypothetical protein